MARSNTLYLSLALIILFPIILIGVKRFQTILEVINYPIPFIECFTVVMGALPLVSITPSKSGDVIKAYYLKDKIPVSKTIGSVITERVFDIFTLVLFSLIGMVFYKKYELSSVALIVLIGIIFVFFIPHINLNLPIKESWNNKLQNIIFSMKTLTKNKKMFLITLFYSFSIWFLSVVQTLVFFYALNIEIPLLFTMANIPIAIFIGFIPVTMGGMGTRDTAIIFLFSEYATSSELLGVGILFSVFRYWLLSLIGIPFMKKMASIT